MKRSYRLIHNEARQRAAQDCMTAPDGWCVSVSEPSRNLEQNALMWKLLEAFAEQLPWPVNGKMVKLDSESWKDLLTAAFEGEHSRVAHGLNGGMVLIGQRTSQYSKAKFAEFIEFIRATAAERDVLLPELEAA